MYKSVDSKADFPAMEEQTLEFWEKNAVFKTSILQRAAATEYVFYDGPPFATGLPHFGHFVPGTIKDIIPRYRTMKGLKVDRRFGWDCHGLPVENLVEKELGLNSKAEIEAFGIANFNEACRASVLRYVDEWRRSVTRMGRWVDFDNDYKTMDPDYMESIWWVMKRLWEKGLLYEGHYILPYCPRCSTVLSNHELNLGGYIDVHDPSITVKFRITDGLGASGPVNGKTYLLAWTTTPWTLPSNLALSLGPDIDYLLVKDGDEYYLLAEARLAAYYKQPENCETLWRRPGRDLVGLSYEPLFPYFEFLADQGAFRTILGDFVTTAEGTGIVHIAPGFGEDDYQALKGSGLPTVCPIDDECRFTSEVSDYQGVFVKQADKLIIERLKAEGKLVKREQLLHAYPHCWRCSSPLIYRAVGSWFVNIEKIKPAMLAANDQIFWVPEHIKYGRFGKWLEGARDWAISRNRYWGNPLPIWRCSACSKICCIGSRQELKDRSGVEAQDLHKHFVDLITIPCSCGATMYRVPEVLDCWFESGAMPYGQNHYPFENREFFDSHFPADFINESLDQTRGWFYTLTVLAAALFEKPAFLNCIVSGLVLASDGKKMSKSQRNFTDPMDVVNRFGADALRLFLIHSATVKAEDLYYSDEGVREVLKTILIPLWNAYCFFITYANIDGIAPSDAPQNPTNPLDKWIISMSMAMVEQVSAALDAYDLTKAIDPIIEFIDLLNNWYIRRSRRRFWRGEIDSDKQEAYASLYAVLKTLALTAAPFVPFITEAIWQNLRSSQDPISVHLADYPLPIPAKRDSRLEYKMAVVRKAVSLGRALRYQYNIKVRQPLKSVELVTRSEAEKLVLLEMEEIIREELNVKSVIFHDKEEDLVEYQAKANFRLLGKELGKLMKPMAARIAALSQLEIQSLMDGATLAIEIDGKTYDLSSDKIEIGRIEKANLKIINEGTLTVGLDTELSDELVMEGEVRDLVRAVQNLRKESGLLVTDRIKLYLQGSDRLHQAWLSMSDYIAGEVLAVEVFWTVHPAMIEIAATEDSWRVALEKA